MIEFLAGLITGCAIAFAETIYFSREIDSLEKKIRLRDRIIRGLREEMDRGHDRD